VMFAVSTCHDKRRNDVFKETRLPCFRALCICSSSILSKFVMFGHVHRQPFGAVHHQCCQANDFIVRLSLKHFQSRYDRNYNYNVTGHQLVVVVS